MNMAKKNLRIDEDLILKIINYIALSLIVFIMIYPFWEVFMKSFMSDLEINQTTFVLFPKEFQISGYKTIFTNKVYKFARALLNSVIITSIGTIYQLTITTITAYALSRKNLPGKKIFMFYFIFTMYFGGGLIPYYLVIRNLGLRDQLAVLIIPSFMSMFNMLVMRSFFITLPEDLESSAKIDGAGNLRVFLSIVLPLSKTIIATISLFIGVAFWNNWYSAMLFIQTLDKRPLAYALRIIIELSRGNIGEVGDNVVVVGKSVQYAGIVVAITPIILIYPFLQKHFVKGVLIGSLKE